MGLEVLREKTFEVPENGLEDQRLIYAEVVAEDEVEQ